MRFIDRDEVARRLTYELCIPIVRKAMIAFSKAFLVRIFDIRKSSCTIATMRRPAIRASTRRRESTAGIAALVGNPMPSASTIEAIVDAVPIVMQ